METTITPTTEMSTLASQAWFIELLAGKAFTNGEATIQVDGSQFAANPGGGKAGCKADFHQADRETVTFMVEQILKLRPFLTDEALAQERSQKERVDQALAGIALTIRDGPDTAGGVQLRRFLWSVYNMHHFVNLWRLTAEFTNSARNGLRKWSTDHLLDRRRTPTSSARYKPRARWIAGTRSSLPERL